MNSQVIREVNPESTSGLWREGFMENYCLSGIQFFFTGNRNPHA